MDFLVCISNLYLARWFSGIRYSKFQSFNKNENPEFWSADIAAIEARYESELPKDVIVFTGSSSIRKWETLDKDMAPYPVVNHGFGGSKIADVTYYVDRLITPFQPRAVVLFVGTNDINGVAGNSKTGKDVFKRTKDLITAIHNDLPDIPIYYISISPTKARWKVWPEGHAANQLVSKFASEHNYVTFIDTTSQLLSDNGKPNEGLFTWDGLHLNAEGYAVWASVIYPFLQNDVIAQELPNIETE